MLDRNDTSSVLDVADLSSLGIGFLDLAIHVANPQLPTIHTLRRYGALNFFVCR